VGVAFGAWMWLRGTVEGCGGSKRDCSIQGGGLDCIGINGDRPGLVGVMRDCFTQLSPRNILINRVSELVLWGLMKAVAERAVSNVLGLEVYKDLTVNFTIYLIILFYFGFLGIIWSEYSTSKNSRK
jgi:hypothetical protein